MKLEIKDISNVLRPLYFRLCEKNNIVECTIIEFAWSRSVFFGNKANETKTIIICSMKHLKKKFFQK